MYCSVECQQADRPTHKLLCKSFKDFEQRPAENMRRIIHFPKDGKKPDFMWRPLADWMTEEAEKVVVSKELTDDQVLMVSNIDFNFTTKQPLDYMIGLWYDDSFRYNYEHLNKAIVAATDGKPGDSWKGPFYAECGVGEDGIITKIKDMDMGAFADLVAFLQYKRPTGQRSHGGPTMDVMDIDQISEALSFMQSCEFGERHEVQAPKVDAVKLAYGGEQRIDGQPMVKAVKVPHHHPIFNPKAATSMISESVGMPLHFSKYGNAKSAKFTESDDRGNQAATFMMCNIDFDAESADGAFGKAPKAWDTDVGSVLVARKDRQPLDVEEVKAFASYCQFHMLSWYQSQTQIGSDVPGYAARAELIQKLTPQNWSAYLAQWRKERQRHAGEAAGLGQGDIEV